jgi:hypothetical protein
MRSIDAAGNDWNQLVFLQKSLQRYQHTFGSSQIGCAKTPRKLLEHRLEKSPVHVADCRPLFVHS